MVTRCGCNLATQPFECFGHILHTAVTNRYCENLCSFWDFGTWFLLNKRKIFATFQDTALLNGGLKQIIFRVLVFGFCHWFLVYWKSNLNPIFFRELSYSHCAVLCISSLNEFFDSLSWIKFEICFMALGGW